METSDQYRRFADMLAAAATDADPATGGLLLEMAATWRALAAKAEAAAGGDEPVVDFAQAAERLRRRSA